MRLYISGLKKEERHVIFLVLLPGLGFGSNTGLSKFSTGSWFIIAMLPLALQEIRAEKKTLYRTCQIGFVAVFLFSCAILYPKPARDHLFAASSFEVFKFPALKRIVSSTDRKRALDPLLFEISKRTKPGDTILTYHAIPFVYFATETRHMTNTVFLDMFPKEKFKENLSQMSKMPAPVLIIRTKIYTHDPEWPNVSRDNSRDSAHERIKLLDDWIESQYTTELVWNNNSFESLKPRKNKKFNLNLFPKLNFSLTFQARIFQIQI